MNKLRKGDEIIVLSGKDKGKRGKITKIIGDKLIAEGINLSKKCLKPNPNTNTEGGIIEREASIHRSKVALYNYVTNKADRVGIKLLPQENRKVRYFKSNNELVDI